MGVMCTAHCAEGEERRERGEGREPEVFTAGQRVLRTSTGPGPSFSQ